MRAVIQRVSRADVAIDGKSVGSIGRGLLVLVGAMRGDSEDDARVMADKISKMRIFSDENGKMNLGVNDIGGRVLIVSNFTLLANCRHGNRPDFLSAEEPVRAKALYEHFVSLMNKRVTLGTETGVFGADMKVSLENDGPITIVLDSADLNK